MVNKHVPITIMVDGEDYVASFFDANISASGETNQEAYDGVRELIAESYLRLSEMHPEKLGKGPRRQLAVLSEFIEKAS
jgi:hypothetical protein